MIDYERFMRQQLKKLNPVQQVAYSLIKGDARFISTLIDISKEPSNSDLKKRELRNCLAHYGLGQYIKNSDIVQSDVLKGLTIKAFKKDYFEVKEELYKFMNELADQIKRIIF